MRAHSQWAPLDRAAAGACGGVVLYTLIDALGVDVLIRIPDILLLVGSVLIGAALAWRGWQRALWIILGVGGAATVFIVSTPAINYAARSLVRADATPQSVDAVVVLSGGVTPDSQLNPTSLDRLLAGVEMIRHGVSHTLAVSEPRIRLWNGSAATAAPDVKRIVSLVGPAELLELPGAVNTADEAGKASELARQRGFRRVAVVTSPTHTRRACQIFERAGLQVVCVPSQDRSVTIEAADARSRLWLFRAWFREQLGLARDWLRPPAGQPRQRAG
jgi:uncharacterized SAM-binding protein YcdF (DUF218 family)